MAQGWVEWMGTYDDGEYQGEGSHAECPGKGDKQVQVGNGGGQHKTQAHKSNPMI